MRSTCSPQEDRWRCICVERFCAVTRKCYSAPSCLFVFMALFLSSIFRRPYLYSSTFDAISFEASRARPSYTELGSAHRARANRRSYGCCTNNYHPDAMTLAGRSSVLVVMLLSPVGKLPDATVDKPPPLEPPPLVLSAPALFCINGRKFSSSGPVTSLAPVEEVAVPRIEPPLWVAEGSDASKGTMARSVVVVAADLAAALEAAEAAAALASALAASLSARVLSASSARFCSSASNSCGALSTRCSVVALVEAQSFFFSGFGQSRTRALCHVRT